MHHKILQNPVENGANKIDVLIAICPRPCFDCGLSFNLKQSIQVPIFCQWVLTHWGWVTHICVSRSTNTGSDNGLSDRRQAISWTYTRILITGPFEANISELLIEIRISSFKKMHLKRSSAKCRPSCLGLNMLIGTRSRISMIKFYSDSYWQLADEIVTNVRGMYSRKIDSNGSVKMI